MRILHVVAPGETGGLERVVQALAAGHQARGLDVHLAVVLDPPDLRHPFLSHFDRTGVSVHSVPLPPRAYRQERAAIRGLIAHIRPDVVHTHGYRPDVVDGGVARRMGVPVVATVHGFTGGGWRNRTYERMQRWAYRRCDAVVAVSRPLVDDLASGGVPRQRIRLVRNGWGQTSGALPRAEARAELAVPGSGWRVGWVGRISAEKGADVLIDALPHLADLPLGVSVVGYGREEAALRTRAASLGAGGRVHWHGMVPDAGRVFAAFDAFVLSSRTEGTPVVLFEAMAAGVPIIATQVGGVPDVVASTEAVLVPSNDPRALAAGIRSVFDDPDGAAARVRAARRRLDNEFGLDGWLAGYEDVYREVSARRLVSSNPE